MSPWTTKFCSLSQKVSLRISRYKTDKNVSSFRCSFPWAFLEVSGGEGQILGRIQEGETPLSGGKPLCLMVEKANRVLLIQCGSWGDSQSLH